ncbi:MAG TPA: GtrA family protein [Thermomicrobiales bacterium]|nr:GtrA family protein [Thermomicrobiales bacterium]
METTRGARQARPFATLERLLRPDHTFMRFLRFGLVGGSGVVVNMAALWLLHDELRLAADPAIVLAVGLAIVNNFIWNNFWTFGASGVAARRVVQFAAISLVGMAINVAVFKVLLHFGVFYLLADLGGIAVAIVWNFFANSRWTWGDV